MSRSDLQFEFLQCVSELIRWCDLQGYKITGGELYRTDYQAKPNAETGTGIIDSQHTKRLAIDLNLFLPTDEGWQFQTSTLAHKPLGDFWKSLHEHCRWGGDFSKPDGNHYEFRS